MKNLSILLCSSLFGFFVIYLLGAFVAISFDISEWEPIGRFAVALLGFFSAMYAFTFTVEILNND